MKKRNFFGNACNALCHCVIHELIRSSYNPMCAVVTANACNCSKQWVCMDIYISMYMWVFNKYVSCTPKLISVDWVLRRCNEANTRCLCLPSVRKRRKKFTCNNKKNTKEIKHNGKLWQSKNNYNESLMRCQWCTCG